MPDANFSKEIRAFLNQRPSLLAEYGASWVIFVGADFKGSFPTYAIAAEFALEHFRDAQFLIRNTNAADPDIPMLFAEG